LDIPVTMLKSGARLNLEPWAFNPDIRPPCLPWFDMRLRTRISTLRFRYPEIESSKERNRLQRRSSDMAEKTEKAAKKRAPAKPRAAAGTKKSAAKNTDGAGAVDGVAASDGAHPDRLAAQANGAVAYVPTHEEIAFLALQYWEQRGRAHGGHMQDWLRAERDLMKMAS
jgi:hypothetical protein